MLSRLCSNRFYSTISRQVRPSLNLKDKVVIVTGASSGIGLKSIQALLAANASVFGIDRSPQPEVLKTGNHSFQFYQCDISSPVGPAEIVKVCHDTFGPRIDILQNVAGIMDNFNSADTYTDEMWDRIMAVNLTAPVKLMREVLKDMKKQGSGTIINVASSAGVSGCWAGVAYTASKHGIVGATRNVAWRFHAEGIRCNAILPGGIATNIQKSYDPDKNDMNALDTLLPLFGLQATVQPDEVANLMLFLSSDLSRHITGATIPVGNALT